MPNFDTVNEALKALNKQELQEGFAELGPHYEKHAVKNSMELQRALNKSNLVYLMPTQADYGRAAKELADEDAADQNLTTTKTGTISFAGTQNTEFNSDSIYKIRFKSKFVDRQYLLGVLGNNAQLADGIIDAYKGIFETEDFCDIVIYKRDGKELTSNKTLLTFYLAKRSRADSIVRQCNVYDDVDKKTAAENIKEQILVVQHPAEKQSLEFIVVKPDKAASTNKKRKGGVDNYTSYKSGSFFSSAKDEFIDFDLDGKISGHLKTDTNKEYSLSSKKPALAKETFKLAACKTIFEEENTGSDNFRQEKHFKTLLSVWASTIYDVINFIDNEPKIREYIRFKYGIEESHDYQGYKNILDGIKRDIRAQWNKLSDHNT